MKKIPLVLISTLLSFYCQSQESAVRFEIKNSSDKSIYILNNDYSDPSILFGERGFDLPLTDGKATYRFNLSKPTFVNMYFRSDSSQRHSVYALFLTPGDNLQVSVDASDPKTSCVVTGIGSENNQPLIQPLSNGAFDLDTHKKDSLPTQVFNTIKKQDLINRKTLENYISTYHPTAEFMKAYSRVVESFVVREFIDFKGNQKFNIRKAYDRNENQWQALEDSLARAVALNNDELLGVPGHVYFLPTYITRIKERLWKHPELLADYFPAAEGATILKDDPENAVQEKIINKHFTGKTAEFLYALLLKDAIDGNEDNVPQIFARFKQAYPASQYSPFIEPGIKKIEERSKRKLTSEMIIVENPDAFQTFDDVLHLVKGKTVLLDMWGSWCGPCRSELAKNSDAIKSHFKGKALDYLYIANHDSRNERKWKELIPYYNMTGTHILASKNLTNDIMTRIKGFGFPTYVIIKRDGSFELSEAGYPMDRELLFKQIDRALK